MKTETPRGPARKSIAVSLDEETIARIDALRPHFSSRGRDATRSDVLREVIIIGLDGVEKTRPTREPLS